MLPFHTKKTIKNLKDVPFSLFTYSIIIMLFIFYLIFNYHFRNSEYPMGYTISGFRCIVSQEKPIQITNENIIKIHNVDSNVTYVISKEGVEIIEN